MRLIHLPRGEPFASSPLSDASLQDAPVIVTLSYAVADAIILYLPWIHINITALGLSQLNCYSKKLSLGF